MTELDKASLSSDAFDLAKRLVLSHQPLTDPDLLFLDMLVEATERWEPRLTITDLFENAELQWVYHVVPKKRGEGNLTADQAMIYWLSDLRNASSLYNSDRFIWELSLAADFVILKHSDYSYTLSLTAEQLPARYIYCLHSIIND